MTWLKDRQQRVLETELAAQLKPLDALLRKPAIRKIAAALTSDSEHDQPTLEHRCVSLIRISESCLSEALRIEAESSNLLIGYQQALDETERQEILRKCLFNFPNSHKSRERDLKAVNRWLDAEAIRERYSTLASQCIDEVLVCHDCVGHILRHAQQGSVLSRNILRTGIVATILAQANESQRSVIRRSALSILEALTRLVDPNFRSHVLGVKSIQQVIRWARGDGATRWVQAAALSLLALITDNERLTNVLEHILTHQFENDSMVVRAACIRLLPTLNTTERERITARAMIDPSEHVRQELARTLVNLPNFRCARVLCRLILQDRIPRVRGVALSVLVQRASHDSRFHSLTLRVLSRSLSPNQPALVIRIAIDSIRKLVISIPNERIFLLSSQLCELVASSTVPPTVSEHAAAALRLLDVEAQKELAILAQKLRTHLDLLDEGESCTVQIETPIYAVARALRIAARGDHAVALTPIKNNSFRLTRGEPRKLRLWRLWHEFRTPMPDKRKGYVHSKARAPYGPFVVPPIGMAEVTPTRVPGERVLHGRVGGWGVFLPRIDDLLTAILKHSPVFLVTSFGTIVVQRPSSLRRRFKAWLWLTHNYAKASLVRESSLEAHESAEQLAFERLIHSLGFQVHLEDRDCEIHLPQSNGALANSAVCRIDSPLISRYLSRLSPLSSWFFIPPDLLQQFFVHALSPTANDPFHLALVVWVILFFYVVRAAAIMQSIVTARNAIPLRIGGWGTRGKSGSERLKAALFHALRYDVVVKTTGCEAMFIHAQRDLPAQEIFIYRPYDKATIWEQRNMLNVAQRLKAQVFLWECMALQPRFVETLIHEWMKDPVTTLTNAYPDHEDIQGPGGEDVARVIGRFSPAGGVTFTTEEQMLPLLKDAAKKKGAKLVPVELFESDLLPQDLLDRLPYQEHPRNVALILALAEHFEIDREVALVEIADYVVLDLGVLKTYPEASYRGRRLAFSNGMSANERAGFMSNWTRLAFDRHDVDENADTVTVAVVNNRADRVARSRVFAQILVDDASLTSIVLINGNLGGLLSFITEALDRKLTQLRITGDGPKERVLERAREHLKWLKVPMRRDAVSDCLQRMLAVLNIDPERVEQILTSTTINNALNEANAVELENAFETLIPIENGAPSSALRNDVKTHILQLCHRVTRARQVLNDIQNNLSGPDEVIDNLFRKAYRELFLDRIHILWNSGATGDQVIDFMTNTVPPGVLVRIMGCQNIKGTGLDFVYRWLSIDRVRTALLRLDSHPNLRQETLAWLGSYNDFGLLDASDALSTLVDIRNRKDPSWASLEHLLYGVVTRLEQLVLEKQAKLHAVGKADLFSRVAGFFEALIDHLDSASRSKKAAQVMDDLFAARVGHGKAALLLRDITGRQKGGWLAKDIKKRLNKLH
jgi:poly-gamma-glutamate synthase PgsB/CapB